MSIDDTELDARLREHAQRWQDEFAPPPLAGQLAAVTASRPSHHKLWLGSLVAAIVVLVVPLATVAGIHRWFGARTPLGVAAPSRSSQLLGDVPWAAAVLQPDGRTVTVQADVNATPGYCLDDGMPALTPVVTETPTTVRIKVLAYRRLPVPSHSVEPGVARGCSDVGHGPVAVSARLDSELAARTVTDGAGHVESVFDAAGFPQPAYLPDGYSGGQVTQSTIQVGEPLRTYTKQQDELQIIRGAFRLIARHVLATGTVHGQPATVAQDGSFTDNVCASWSEGGFDWSVCSIGAPSAPLSPSELLKIANSLR